MNQKVQKMNHYSGRQTVYLSRPNARVIRKILADLPHGRRVSWLYLGKNYLKRQNVARILGNSGNLIETSDKLQETAVNFRQDYIDFIGRLNRSQANNWWWLTTVSEKKPLMNDVFLNFCYLKLAVDHISDQSEDLLIIAESPALLYVIAENIPNKPGRKVSLFSCRFFENVPKITSIFKKGIIFSAFAMNNMCNLVQSRIFRHQLEKHGIPPPRAPAALLYSWTDHRSFSDPARYNNVYFGDLGAAAIKKGIFPLYLIQTLPTIRYSRAVKELLKRPDTYILLEEYVTIPDIVRALAIGRKITLKESDIPEWNKMNVTGIITDELRKDRFNTRSKRSYLIYCAIKRICREFSFSSVVYPFENLVWEKMLCLGVRESTGGIFLTGYAHSSIISMNTNYSLSAYESSQIPLPDRIVVNGNRGKEILLRSGFCGFDILVAGAIRYMRNDDRRENNPLPDKNHPSILVALPAGVSETIEMVMRVHKAFADDSSVGIVLKPHPISQFSKIKEHLPDFPEHMNLCTTPIDQLLMQSDLLLYTDSTASIEALSKGIPALHIKYELTIDINPLAGYECIPSVSSPEMIRKVSLELIRNKEETWEKYQEVAAQFFEPLHDNYVRIFLGCETRND